MVAYQNVTPEIDLSEGFGNGRKVIVLAGMGTTTVTLPFYTTGRARLIRSHSSARFCFELSGNSN